MAYLLLSKGRKTVSGKKFYLEVSYGHIRLFVDDYPRYLIRVRDVLEITIEKGNWITIDQGEFFGNILYKFPNDKDRDKFLLDLEREGYRLGNLEDFLERPVFALPGEEWVKMDTYKDYSLNDSVDSNDSNSSIQ